MKRCGEYIPNGTVPFPMMQISGQKNVPSSQFDYNQPVSSLPAFPTAQPMGQSLVPSPASTGLTGAASMPPGMTSMAHTPIATFTGSDQPPQTLQSTMYIPGYLKTQIGKRVRVEFLIGTTTMTDRVGTLVGVGASYILLRLEASDDIILCDIYSIKFITFYR